MLYQLFISGAFTVIAAGLGVWLGAVLALRGYFRQKEYDLVKERYLEGAIDIVASELEQCLGVVRHNWARCLNILKAFRDEKSDFELDELSKGFRDLNMDLNRIALHRIGGLVGVRGAQVIWTVYQIALADAANNNTVYTKEIPETIRKKLTTSSIKIEPEEIVERLIDDLQRRDEKSNRFASLARVLYHLGAILERERMTFKEFGKIQKRPEVMDILAELKRDFAKDLANEDEKPSDARRNIQQG